MLDKRLFSGIYRLDVDSLLNIVITWLRFVSGEPTRLTRQMSQ
jgi:hypothetical protein